MRIDLDILVHNRRTEDDDSDHPCIWWDLVCPPIDDNSCGIDLGGRNSIESVQVEQKQEQTILGQRKSHIMR